MPQSLDANPVYGGPYLDQHVPDPDVPQSMPSASVGTNTVSDAANASGTGNLTGADTANTAATATAETSEEAALKATEPVDPSASGSFTPDTDATLHL